MTTPLIEFKKVTKRFNDKAVLDQIDLEVYPGEVTTLIGKSGVGKSVTLKLIIGLLKPDQGDIFYKGKNMKAMSWSERKSMHNKVNFMFQNNALFDSLNIFDNIALPLKEKTKLKKKVIRDRVEKKMALLELEGIEHKFPSQISGGMQKRVALARALITEPEAVLFDEPTAGLDPVRKNNVLNMITKNQRDFGFTAMVVSHDVPDVLYISNRTALIDEGRILFQGPPQDLEQIRHPVINEFISSSSNLKNEIIGLNSRQKLESSYQEAIQQGLFPDPFSVLFIHIEHYKDIQEEVGDFAAYKIMAIISKNTYKYLSENSVCGSYTKDQLLCIIPASYDPGFLDFLSQGLRADLRESDFLQKYISKANCMNFSLQAGLISASPNLSLNDLYQEVKNQLKNLIEITCKQSQGSCYDNSV